MNNGGKQHDLEHVACDLCGADATAPYHRAPSLYSERLFDVVRCAECGLIYVNPRMADKERRIRQHSSKAVLETSRQETFLPSCIERSRLLSMVRLRRIGDLLAGGRLLDFGCGNGTFVYTALSEGWDAVGIDLNEGLIEAAGRYWKGLPLGRGWGNARMESGGRLAETVRRHREEGRLFSTSLHDLAKEHAGPYDIVNSSQVLEHLVSPMGTVALLAGMLRRGGWLVADVPNIRCWRERVRRGSSLDPTAHLYYFDLRSIRRLLEANGFEVAYTDTRMTLFGLWFRALAPLGLAGIVPALSRAARFAPLPAASSNLIVAARKK